MKQPQIYMVRVFPLSPDGGNPAPICLNCHDLASEDMRRIAVRHELECGFVLPPDDRGGADHRFRFFVPNHEMEMCGHATIGALWLLRELNEIQPGARFIETISGLVEARVPETGPISIDQSLQEKYELTEDHAALVLDCLGVSPENLRSVKLLNVSTSRTKTLVPVKSKEVLNTLSPNFERIADVCERVGSTGLYPFSHGDAEGQFSARQFPRSSGYPEDAATGIAASALAFGLLEYGFRTADQTVLIRQGEAMNRPSEIRIDFERSIGSVRHCWISGACVIEGKLSVC